MGAHREGPLVGGEPPRLFKRDTVSETFNKAENNLGCQICLPKTKYPEWLLPIDGGENSIFPKPEKKRKEKLFSREEKFCFCSGMGSGN